MIKLHYSIIDGAQISINEHKLFILSGVDRKQRNTIKHNKFFFGHCLWNTPAELFSYGTDWNH